jgi:hypothetical protein
LIIGELYRIEAADGLIYALNDGETRYVVTTIDNAGLPPVEYLTRRPYRSDRLIETGFRLNPRSFSIAYQFMNECSRDEYWQARAALLNITRPNRGGALTVTITLEDGTRRAIRARALTPVFPAVPVEEVNEWNFSEIVQFDAFDPTFFNPNFTSTLVLNEPAEELVFPIHFDDDNIYFGAGSIFGSMNIPYLGTWYSYPVITVTPPYQSVRIFHEQLNVAIEVLRNSSTESLIIDLENGTIRDQDGNSVFNYVAPDSDLQGFRLEPDPIVANGDNTLIFTIPGAVNPATTVLVSYKERFIGI